MGVNKEAVIFLTLWESQRGCNFARVCDFEKVTLRVSLKMEF